MSSPDTLLSGVALITGGASGIGRATSLALVSHGVRRLGILDIDMVKAEETALELKSKFPDVEVILVHADMANEESVITGINKIVQNFGRIDYAVNNAGVGGKLGPTTEISGSDFRSTIDINLIGLWVCQREEIRHMLKQEPLENGSAVRNRGVIVNMSSMLGAVGTCAETPAAAYCARQDILTPEWKSVTYTRFSKHGIVAITKSDANYYGPENIRINAICPGFVSTPPMLHALRQSEIMKAELQKVPLRRFAKPEEIAEGVCFLASPMSGYMCGAAMLMDGGYTAQ
ncbi:short chain dehydrogenase/ reductase [Hyaloscypha variabilis]